jgi:hypothetical protein
MFVVVIDHLTHSDFPDGDQSQPDGFAFGVTCTPEQKVDGPYTRQDHCIGPFSLGLSHAGKDSLV